MYGLPGWQIIYAHTAIQFVSTYIDDISIYYIYLAFVVSKRRAPCHMSELPIIESFVCKRPPQ